MDSLTRIFLVNDRVNLSSKCEKAHRYRIWTEEVRFTKLSKEKLFLDDSLITSVSDPNLVPDPDTFIKDVQAT